MYCAIHSTGDTDLKHGMKESIVGTIGLGSFNLSAINYYYVNNVEFLSNCFY